MMDDEINLPSVNWFLEKSQACFKNEDKIDYKNLNIRPPHSYSQIIVFAFIYYGFRKLSLSDIYAYFVQEYGYFKQPSKSWKNSVRHLLSLDKRFIKIPREKGEKGKGAFWLLDKQSINLDGTLKQSFPVKQNRKMPLVRAKKEKPDPDMKPHINPIVMKYLKRIRPRYRPQAPSCAPVEAVPDAYQVDEHVFEQDQLAESISSENVGSFEFDDMALEHQMDDCASTANPDEVFNLEFTPSSSIDTCHDDNDLFFVDFDSANLDFASPESFDEFLTNGFLDEYSQDFQFQF